MEWTFWHQLEEVRQLLKRSTDGVLRLYVDGTSGDDGHYGWSWDEAWRTYAKLEASLGAILAQNPTDLSIRCRIRGAFDDQSFHIAGKLYGRTSLNIFRAVDDWVEVKAGTLATIAAPTLAHTLREATFNGMVVDSSDESLLAVFEDGLGHRHCSQILRVWDNGGTPTATLGRNTFPSWVVGGGGVTASLRVPPVGASPGPIAVHVAANADHALWRYRVNILGLGASHVLAKGTSGSVQVWQPSAAVFDGFAAEDGCGYLMTYASVYYDGTNYWYMERDLAQEMGLIGEAPMESGEWSAVGSRLMGTGNAVRSGGGSCVALRGWCSGQLFAAALGQVSTLGVLSNSAGAQHGMLSVTRSIVRGKTGETYAMSANHFGEAIATYASVIEPPATGYTAGMLQSRRNSNFRVDASVDGINTGTGADLRAVKVFDGGNVQFNGAPNVGLKGKHGFLSVVDGKGKISGNYTHGAMDGAGPDIYVEAGDLYIDGNIAKTAPNTVGSSIVKARRGARVEQAAGRTFVLPAGSGNNATDYGAGGAIDAETDCSVALGTPSGGNAAATGTAVRVKKGSRLAHTGSAPSWGAAALDLGGAAAQAMPANPTSDLAAGTPENCWVLPGAD